MQTKKKNQHPAKSYNIFQTAEFLGVHERTIRYWIKKKWITPRRDHRNYPVFTKKDVSNIKKWHNTLRKA